MQSMCIVNLHPPENWIKQKDRLARVWDHGAAVVLPVVWGILVQWRDVFTCKSAFKYREFFEESHRSVMSEQVHREKPGPSIYIDVADRMSHLSNSVQIL